MFIKVGDYGSSLMLDINKTITLMTSKGYTAPEILKGELFSTPVDVFSLGCILYEAMTGQNPFINKRGLINQLKQLTCEYTPISDKKYSEKLKQICYIMLKLSPEERPTVRKSFSDAV